MKKTLLMAAIGFAALSASAAPGLNETNRLVITYRDGKAATSEAKTGMVTARIKTAQRVRVTEGNAVIYDLGKTMSLQEARDLARQFKDNPDVVSAEPDIRVKSMLTPSDPYFSDQWNLAAPNGTAKYGGINIAPLWARVQGANVKMAVLDTGIVAHPELANAILPGYDFVSDPTMAADGGGRDSDPTDPGDYCEAEGTSSTWHGTKVAGIMAAAADNNGIVGVAPSAKLLNVRVLGRCGGWLSDVADAIRWTAGAPVAGIPAHGHGPLIMNLSLATDPSEACPAFMQDAVNTAYNVGALVVAAAGNEGVNKVGAPGNCAKVVTVASHTGTADLAAYSNYSSAVTISGPGGGDCKKATAGCSVYPAATLGVTGRKELTGFTGPVYMAGTSAAAPYVAATLGLLRELNPAASASALVSALSSTARAFPAGSFCAGNSQCAFGMLDAGKAADFLSGTSALGVSATASPMQSRAGDTVTLTAAGTSAVQGMTYSYAWTQVSGPTVTLSRADQATASFVTPSATGTAVFSVRMADAMNNAAVTTVSVVFSTNSAPVIAAVKTQKAVVGQPWTLTLSVSDADSNFDRINLLNAPSGVVVTGTTLTWPNPTVGSRVISLIAVDKEGAESAVVEFGLDVTAEGGTGISDGGGDGGGGNLGMLGGLLMALAGALKLRARRD